MAGFSEMDLNPMVGIITRGIITQACSEIQKILNRPVFLPLSSLFFPEDNEILKDQSAEWQFLRKKSYNKAGFPENLAHIFLLPDMHFHYPFFIQPHNEGFKEKLGKNLDIFTNNREENC
jgi:hypothetical protein